METSWLQSALRGSQPASQKRRMSRPHYVRILSQENTTPQTKRGNADGVPKDFITSPATHGRLDKQAKSNQQNGVWYIIPNITRLLENARN